MWYPEAKFFEAVKCNFADWPNTPPDEKPEERRFTCVHGKTLRWSKARAALGLPPIIDPGVETKNES